MATTQNTYTGNGSTTNYSFTFEYLKQSDVKVTLDTVATTAFTFANATTLSFTSAPANNVAIRIFRDTAIDTLSSTFFPGSTIKAEDLNQNFTQNLYVTQESETAVDISDTTANDAKTTAEGAVTTANSAVTTANSAVTTANSAVTTANSAVNTANAASVAVSNAVLFTLVATVAAIPGSPSNNDFIEIGNSTGIESFSPLSGLPSGFVGASGLTVRLRYDSSASTWVFMSYFANDSEDRYLTKNIPLGSATAPSLAFTGDTNTGIYSPGADQVAITTGETERLRIASTGAMGLSGANYGTAGQVLVSNGSSASPTWEEVGAPNTTYTYPGGVEQTIQARLEKYVNVQDFIPEGTDTTITNCSPFIQAAVDAAHAAGARVYFDASPDGVYRCTETITLPVYTVLSGSAGLMYYPSAGDQSAGGDNSEYPDWAKHSPCIQCEVPNDGALFSCSPRTGSSCFVTFEYMCFRNLTGSNMVFDEAYSRFKTDSCLFHRFGPIMPADITKGWGGLKIHKTYFNICGDRTHNTDPNPFDNAQGLFEGAIVDCIITESTFTECTKPFVFQASAGLNIISNNRIEQGGGPAITLETAESSRYNVIEGNLFDGQKGPAIRISYTTAPTIISNNLFWRNGQAVSQGGTTRSQDNCHISMGAASELHITGNTFQRGPRDGQTINSLPKHIALIGSMANEGVVKFTGNETHNGCTSSRIFAQLSGFGESRGQFDIDGITIPNPIDYATGNNIANTDDDDFADGLNELQKIAVQGARVFVCEDRQINTSPTVSKLLISGAGASNGVAFGDYVPGTEYRIFSAGNTDWTALGAASNTANITFIATTDGSSQAGTSGIATRTTRITLKNKDNNKYLVGIANLHNIRYVKYNTFGNAVSFDVIRGLQYASNIPDNNGFGFAQGKWDVGSYLYKYGQSSLNEGTPGSGLAYFAGADLGTAIGWETVADTTGAANAPTVGYHYPGEIVFNNAPVAGGYAGWVCVTEGTPGSWKQFGVIES